MLSQLGARVQHALRAFTPDDQKALARTVKTYPKSPHYDLETALTSLGIGEAIVTVLSERGAPTPVAWTRLRAPRSKMGSIGADAIRAAVASSELNAKYAETIDRESAYEKLTAKAVPAPGSAPVGESEAPAAPRPEKEEPGMLSQVLSNPAVKSFMRSAASSLGREFSRGLFGNRRR
ncbi:hypothetical protein GCM10027360_26890 [Amycolatopsis echigonensis]